MVPRLGQGLNRVSRSSFHNSIPQPRLSASWLVSLLVLCLTGIAVALSANRDAVRSRSKIEREERVLVGTIRARMEGYLRALEQTAAFVRQGPNDAVAKLPAYAEDARLFQRLPGLQ